MSGRSVAVVASLALLSLCMTAVAADITIKMAVAPNVLVLSAPTNWVTIHTNILLSSVESVAAKVNGQDVDIAFTKADSCGLMVVKIAQAEVDPYVSPGTATFALTGTTVDGLDFEGSNTIQVKK
jgi:hypothetical protein